MSINKTLPRNEKTFTLDIEGETTGTKYAGDFTVICVLNGRQKSQAALVEARLNQGLALDGSALGLHFGYSQIKVRVTDAPKWFTESDCGMTLLDENVLLEVFEECRKAETEYRELLKPTPKPEVKAEE